jgi:hypothetical protein
MRQPLNRPARPASPPSPSSQSRAWRRVSTLFTRPKLPAWAFILLGIVQWVPDWKSRIEFWLAAARGVGGHWGTMATVVASPYFSLGLSVFGIAWLAFIGEPAHGVQRDPRWRFVGWSVFAVCLTAIVVTAGYGAIEIYIREQIATREATILHDGTNSNAKPQPPDPAFSFQRRLSPDQFRALVQQGTKLKAFFADPLLIGNPPGDSEAFRLGKDISDALTRAGVATGDITLAPAGPDQTGVMIAVPDLHNPTEEAEQLRQALEIIGIIPKYITTPKERLGAKNAPILFIGPKPI